MTAAGSRSALADRAATGAQCAWRHVRRDQEEVISPQELANVLAKAALEKKARDLVILDMSEVITYADIFLICSASSRRQVRAIADTVLRTAKNDHSMLPTGVEGQEAGRWVLVDFGDVVFHIFDEALRGFYDLDRLWGDATPLPLPEVEVPEESEDDDPVFKL